MNKPIVGITMGDPAGSGPEITIKALADPEQYTYCRPIVVGDVKVFEQARKFVGREDIVIHRCDKVSDALFTPGTIDVLHLDLIEDIWNTITARSRTATPISTATPRFTPPTPTPRSTP